MQVLTHRAPLRLGLSDPFGGSGAIRLGRQPTGSGCRPVKNGPVDRRVDDVVVGHAFPPLNTLNVAQSARSVAFDRRRFLNERTA